MVVDHRFLEKHGARSAPSAEQIAGIAGARSRQNGGGMSDWEAVARGRRITRLIISLVAFVAVVIVVGTAFVPRGFWSDLFGTSAPPPAPAPTQGQ